MTPSRRLAATGCCLAVCSLTVAACGQSSTEVTATESVFRVEVEQCQVTDLQVATAAAVDSDLAATVAHSLDGVKSIAVTDAAGRVVPAEIIYVDGDRDVALLRLSGSTTSPLQLAEPEVSSRVSIATSAAEDGPLLKPAVVLDLVSATLDGQGRRAAIKLEADVEPGDSGAAVVDDGGRMVGMVFATARNDEVGWAVAVSEIRAALEQVDGTRPEALPPAC